MRFDFSAQERAGREKNCTEGFFFFSSKTSLDVADLSPCHYNFNTLPTRSTQTLTPRGPGAEAIGACGSPCSTCSTTPPQLWSRQRGPLPQRALLISHTMAHTQFEITFSPSPGFFPVGDNTGLRESR